MKKLNFAILGCGRISAKHIDAIIANKEEAELVAVYDIKKDLAVEKKYKYESAIPDSCVKVYTDYNDFIKDNSIDVVSITSISGYHAKHARDCLNHGKHIIIEKPMALNLNDAEDIIRIAERVNKKICVSFQNRFLPAIQRLKEAVDHGKFGKIIHGSARTLWNRNDDYYKQALWRGTKDLDGGTLINQCIHNIDLLQWLLGGEFDRIYLETDTFIRNIEVEDFGALLIRFKNGAVGVVEGSVCVYPKNLEETISIFGEKGTVVIKNGLVETWVFEDKNFSAPSNDVVNEGHAPLYRDMVFSLRNDVKPLIDGVQGKKVLEILLD